MTTATLPTHVTLDTPFEPDPVPPEPGSDELVVAKFLYKMHELYGDDLGPIHGLALDFCKRNGYRPPAFSLAKLFDALKSLQDASDASAIARMWQQLGPIPTDEEKWEQIPKPRWGCGSMVLWKLDRRPEPWAPTCKKWTCSRCAKRRAEENLENGFRQFGRHLLMWVAIAPFSKELLTRFNQRVSRLRKGGQVVHYCWVLRGPAIYIYSNVDLSEQATPPTSGKWLPGFQTVRHLHQRLALPGVTKVKWGRSWRLPAEPKTKTQRHLGRGRRLEMEEADETTNEEMRKLHGFETVTDMSTGDFDAIRVPAFKKNLKVLRAQPPANPLAPS